MKNISELFTNIVAEYLHKLVDSVGNLTFHKILVHEWVVGIEYNWGVFTRSSDDSDFVARLSLRIGGWRSEFAQAKSQKEVTKLLYQTFDAMTFCYFDYGAEKEVETIIEDYCKAVDGWFGELILQPKLKRFKLSRKAIPLLEETLGKLKKWGFTLDKRKGVLSEDITNATGLEKEFQTLFSDIIEEFIRIIKRNISDYNEIKLELDKFLEGCKELGYPGIITKAQSAVIEDIQIRLELRDLLIDSHNNLSLTNKGLFDVDELVRTLNSGISSQKVKENVLSQLSLQIVNYLTRNDINFDEARKESRLVEDFWKRYGLTILSDKDKSEIGNIQKVREFKTIIRESYEILKEDLSIDIDSKLSKINALIDIKRIELEISSQLSKELLNLLASDISKYELLEQKIQKIVTLWNKDSILLFDDRGIQELQKLANLRNRKLEMREIVEKGIHNLQKIDSNLPELDKHNPLSEVISSEVAGFNENQVITYMFIVQKDILKRYPEKGKKIFEEIEDFIKKTSKKFDVKTIKREVDNLKEKAYLKVKIVNLFRFPKKNIEISLMQGSKKIKSGSTNEDGEVVFTDIPKTEVNLRISNSPKERNLLINDYYLEKTVWLFTI
jgi:hypothetical protein